MPTGDELTDPIPFPDDVTVKVLGTGENVAVTFLPASIVTWQTSVPEQAPLHPVKNEFISGAAVSCMTVP
jgi:hypothetical protein